MRGLALLNQSYTKAARFGARDLFEQALNLDPANADALAGAAYVDSVDYTLGWSDQQMDLYARGMQRANQALLLDPNQARAHSVKAYLLLLKAKPNDASANEVIAEAEASLRADPSYASAYFPMAVGEELLGRYEQSRSHLEQAIKISPRDSSLGVWRMNIGRDLLALGEYDAAIQEGLKAIELGDSNDYVLHLPCGVLRGRGQNAGGEGCAGGGDEIGSQTLSGVVSRAHPQLYQLAAGFP